ncbi:alkaline phosphatase family protein [Nocardioides jiangxiensis]|uniref:Alkaline phosphatase family protein n=1 Tax=Nocardioides jiangxiensis TaxID=3064524 RepID=A0ABT9B8I9_9ACTN|nr:nucleotide pyrophosphatase/phosphodiesterase family protein [Nocardioides sp. WY-20]MDO7869463.1 alkaline phosphatase family protein [Nocardioides sp. WY-20]
MSRTEAGLRLPAYGERSIADVVPAVAAALGKPLGTTPSGLVLPSAPAYVVLLVDGLGQQLLERYAHAAPYLTSLRGSAGTAGVPSTTATSLTSLGTGLVPGQHGLVGYTARVPETGELLNHLQWDRDVDPLAYQPHETAFAQLAARGIYTAAVNKKQFATSGLTRAAHRGATYRGADTPGDRLAETLESADGPSFTYVYDADLDKAGHQYGVASSEWLVELQAIDEFAEDLRDALPTSVRLLVVADHGMVDSPAASRFELDRLPELRRGVTLVGGEARFRHLYVREGALDDVLAAWRGHLGDRATVLSRDEAVARGWFGPVEDRVAARLGDVMVACHDDVAVFSTADFPREQTMVGLHGSLTRDEMEIPILIA